MKNDVKVFGVVVALLIVLLLFLDAGEVLFSAHWFGGVWIILTVVGWASLTHRVFWFMEDAQ